MSSQNAFAQVAELARRKTTQDMHVLERAVYLQNVLLECATIINHVNQGRDYTASAIRSNGTEAQGAPPEGILDILLIESKQPVRYNGFPDYEIARLLVRADGIVDCTVNARASVVKLNGRKELPPMELEILYAKIFDRLTIVAPSMDLRAHVQPGLRLVRT